MESIHRTAGMHALLVLLISGAAGCGRSSGQPRVEPDRTTHADGRSVEDMFAGRFPGVEVARAPTGGITVRIRSGSTILAGTEPIYIIDGARVQSGPGGLLFLDPNDIQRIEVLKDIGSTALYGSEGANGVIIITTKWAR